MNLCYMLRYFRTSLGEVVFMALPHGMISRLGMVLQKPASELQWTVAGLGLPLILDMLPEKIEPHYGSDRIFNCDLKPVNHTRSIEGETVLEIKGGYGMEAQGMEKAEQ